MANPRKTSQSVRLTPLLQEYAATELRLEQIRTRRDELEDLIRARLLRVLGSVGYHGKGAVAEVAMELAEDFPQVREILGFASFKAAAEWILEVRQK